MTASPYRRHLAPPRLPICGVLAALLWFGAADAQTEPSAQFRQKVQQLMTAGSDAMQQGRAPEAVADFKQATEAAPDFSSAFLGLGLAELRTGQVPEAERALGRALALDPHTPGAHLFLGIAQYQSGDAAAAAMNLNRELAAQPDNLEALTWLGIVELGAGHPEAAAPPLDHAVALQPGNAQLLYYQGRAHAAVAEQAYQALYKLDPDSALVHRALGESLASSGQPEKAIAEYEAALRKQPDNADLYESLAEENQKLSRFDAALAAYRQELKLNPHSAVALYNIGKIDVERGKAEEGVPLLDEAAKLHASSAPTQFYRGLGLAALGRNAEAAKSFEASLAAQPSPFIAQSAWYQLGRAYQKLDKKADAEHAFAEVQRLKQEAQANTH